MPCFSNSPPSDFLPRCLLSATSNGFKRIVLGFENGEQSTERMAGQRHRFFTQLFSPPPPPRDTVGLRTRLHFLALVSTTAVHRLDLITSLGNCNCKNCSLSMCSESVTAGVFGRDLSLPLPISFSDSLGTETSSFWRHLDFDKAPGHALVFCSLVSDYPTDSQVTVLALGREGFRQRPAQPLDAGLPYVPISVASRRLNLHRTWQHPRWPSSGPRWSTSLRTLHENTVPASTECDPLHRRAWPSFHPTSSPLTAWHSLQRGRCPQTLSSTHVDAHGRRPKHSRSACHRSDPGNFFTCSGAPGAEDVPGLL